MSDGWRTVSGGDDGWRTVSGPEPPSWIERAASFALPILKASPFGLPFALHEAPEDLRKFGHAAGSLGRGLDTALGLGAEGVAGLESGALKMLPQEKLATPEGQAMLRSVEDLRQKGERLRTGQATYGKELADTIPDYVPPPETGESNILPPVARFFEREVPQHGVAALKGTVQSAGDLARDPLTYGPIGALKALGVGGKVATRAATAAFTIQAGREVPGAFKAAKQAYEEDGEWTPRATRALTEAALATGAALWGAKHAAKEGAQMIAETVPKGRGLVYEHDPMAKPEDIAARREYDAAQAARQAEIDAQQASAAESAGKRLLWERGDALRSVRGERALEPTPGSPAAEALARAEAAAAEGLATGAGQRPPIVERYTKGKNAGQPKLSPRQRALVQKRLMQLWADEGGPTKAPAGVEGPVPVEAAPSTALERVSRGLLRVIEPSFDAMERIPVIGPEVAGRMRAYVTDHEKLLGPAEEVSTRALQGLEGKPGRLDPASLNDNPNAQAIQKWLDAHDDANTLLPLDTLPEAARPAAEALRSLKLSERQQMIEAGLIKPTDPLGMWPRRVSDPVQFSESSKALQYARDHGVTYEQALSEIRKPGSILTAGTRAGRKAGQERARQENGLKEGEYRTDWGAWFEALHENTRRIAEARHLGKDGERLTELIDKIPERGKFGDRAFAIKLADRLRGAEPQDALSAASSAVRAFQSGVGLIASPITQAATLQNTAAETSIPATLKSLRDTFWRKVQGPNGQPMEGSKFVRRVRDSMNDARLDAQRQGAVYASQAQGVMDYWSGKTAGDQGSKFSEFVSRLPHVRGTGWTDSLQRVIAAGTAKHIVPEVWDRAKSGSHIEQQQLRKWGIDYKQPELTPEMIDTAAKRIADRSQFRVGVGELPLWASSPLGKVAFQFQSFGYAHTKYLSEAIREASNGNPAPLAKLVTVGAAMGYMTNESKRLIFSGKALQDPSKEDIEKAVKDAYANRESYDPRSPKGAVLAAINGIGAAGGVGALSTIYERVGSGDPLKIMFGATGPDLKAAGRFGAAALEGDPEKMTKAGAALVSGVLPTGPLGANPRELLREVTAAEPDPNPGYAGRLLDVAQGKATPTIWPPSLGENPERVAQGELVREREAANAAEKEAAAMVEKKAPKPIPEKLTDARRARLMAELKRDWLAATRRGDDRAAEEIRARYLALERQVGASGRPSAPLKLGWRTMRDLESRLIPEEANP